MVVARLHVDVGARETAAVDRRHRRLQVDVEAHHLGLLQSCNMTTVASREEKKRKDAKSGRLNWIRGALTTREETCSKEIWDTGAKLTSETRLRALGEARLLPDKVTLLLEGERHRIRLLHLHFCFPVDDLLRVFHLIQDMTWWRGGRAEA